MDGYSATVADDGVVVLLLVGQNDVTLFDNAARAGMPRLSEKLTMSERRIVDENRNARSTIANSTINQSSRWQRTLQVLKDITISSSLCGPSLTARRTDKKPACVHDHNT